MARTLVTRIMSFLQSVLTSADGKTVSTYGDLSPTNITYASGTGANQCDQAYASSANALTVSGGGTPSLTFTLSSLANGQETANFAKVKFLEIHNKSTGSTAVLYVGNAAANKWEGWTPDAGARVKVAPGGRLRIEAPDANGLAVTAGAADQLKIANSSATETATFDLFVSGVKV